MVKTPDDVEYCSALIDHLEVLDLPERVILDLRKWLDREERRLQQDAQERA